MIREGEHLMEKKELESLAEEFPEHVSATT